MLAEPNDEFARPAPSMRRVTIPACTQHEGMRAWRVWLAWTCPTCGGPRGEPERAFSFDGSRRLVVHGWKNPCGHVDHYETVRKEAQANGFNRVPAERLA